MCYFTNCRRLILGLIFLLPVAASLRADTVYSNFSPGYTDSGNAVSVAGNNEGGEYYSVSFSPSNTVTLTSATTDLLWFTGQPTVSAFLLSDNDGLPGSLLATLNQSTPVGNGIVTFACSSNCPVIEAGAQYWLQLQETDPNTDVGWYLSSIDDSDGSNYALNLTYYSLETWWPSGPRNVFEIDGTPFSDPPSNLSLDAPATTVPEPGSLILLLTGLVTLVCVDRIRR
jgi:hypothetical protein